jgi:type IV secretory pathway VirB10-like protein
MSKKKELFSIYPLPASLKQEKQKLKSEVGNFWHNASFVHGWAAPAFLYHDVKAEVDEACDMVVRIRAHCQRKFPEMRTGPGASAEFLWSQQHKPEDKQKFVDQLVEAILSNADGFEPPLDKALVDRYIATIREMRKQATEVKASHVLKSEWEASELLLDEVLEASGHVNESEILAVVDKLRELNVVLEGITNRQRADAEAAAKKEKEEAQRAEEEMARKVEEAKKRQQEQEEAARKAASEAEKKHEDAEEAEEEDDSEDSTSSDERKRMKASMDRALASKGKLIELKKIDMQTQKIASDVKSFEGEREKRV